MLWIPFTRRTRSGADFGAFSANVDALQSRNLDYGMLVKRAVESEDDSQEDCEHEDDELGEVDEEWPPPGPLDGVDEAWPPPPSPPSPPPPDPFNDVDDDNPHPKKRSRRISFDEVVASATPPHKGPHCTRPAPAPTPSASHRRRALKRAATHVAAGHQPAAPGLLAHVNAAVPLTTAFDTSTLPSTHGAYAAKVEDKAEKHGSKVRRSLANLLGLGFDLIRWDGFTPRPIFDANGRIIAVLAGQPRHPEYAAAARAAFCAIMDAGADARFPADMRKHRRGLFAALKVGLSYGKGQKTPGWLNNKGYTPVVERLLANDDIKRLACFADRAFALWAPRLYRYYVDHDKILRTRHSDLRRPFVGSIFFCAAFNFGPNVWTFRHRDVLNLAFGWCGVHALGNFDPTKGGHLVLWDLKLVIEFPPGALILLPSATVAHSNVPVADGEERVSFTQFSADGIFRYLDNGCQTVEELAQNDPEKYEQLTARMGGRWEEGLNLLSTIDELLESE
ncbi:hypothetical protein C8F04DRAFT_1260512 [Mycena alexandri]|uniref:Uncharacterized protein n=1 Tax=Mycena alexandri TaxID=1745969 RepID=A0AAD6STI3_9AGAR|nr:hypothetical protein C8F04DRAFT_1260512 [Mycena alexandri]